MTTKHRPVVIKAGTTGNEWLAGTPTWANRWTSRPKRCVPVYASSSANRWTRECGVMTSTSVSASRPREWGMVANKRHHSLSCTYPVIMLAVLRNNLLSRKLILHYFDLLRNHRTTNLTVCFMARAVCRRLSRNLLRLNGKS